MALVESLKGLLGDVVSLKFKAHGYHWNVEGECFAEYHALFGEIYSDIDSSIDPIAENIRKLGDYAPYKLSRFAQLTVLEETQVTSDSEALATDLLADNDKVIVRLMDAFDVADQERQQGIANFLAERIDMHQKWSWQLRASIKPEPPEAE